MGDKWSIFAGFDIGFGFFYPIAFAVAFVFFYELFVLLGGLITVVESLVTEGFVVSCFGSCFFLEDSDGLRVLFLDD